jgi:lipopolysaccharide export system protein LptC
MNETAPRRESRVADHLPSGRRARSAGGGYSRFVGLMKVVLPLSAGILMLLVVIWPQLERPDEGFRLGVSGMAPGDVEGQRIVNARFNGLDRDGNPFTILAEGAVQPDGGAEPVLLEFPKADMTLDNNSWIAMSADDGAYYKRSQTLDLDGNVHGFHDEGYELRTTRASVDLAAGAASGDMPVAGHGPLGELQGQGFRLTDRGKRILFTGESRLLIYPSGGTADRPGAGAGG